MALTSAKASSPTEQMSAQLIEWLASVSDDPYAYVMGAFPWGEPGTSLENEKGPNEWQTWLLTGIREGIISPSEALAIAEGTIPVQIAAASGHGIGKSACASWIIKWACDTAPDTRGVVTANTEAQLKTKTWAELGKWHNLSITRDYFILTATAYISKDPERERTWRIDAIPWSEKNPEAFAGLHNKGKRLLLLMDEASAIADMIHETAEGAMTDADTQIIWLMFGNPTRNSGRFREAFPGGKFSKYWRTRSIDSRTVPQTNKAQLARWIDAYGEDSDFVRIRVKGEFPRIGEMEFFSSEDLDAAATREVESSPYDPLALGVDVARFGKNFSVLFPRRGRDARTLPRSRHQGLSTVQLADKIVEFHVSHRPAGIMVDGGGVGGGVVDQTRAKQLYVTEVQFGARDTVPHTIFGSGGEKYANMRSGMYGALRAWLKTGAIDNDPALLKQFRAIRYTLNKKDEIQLMSKEDLIELAKKNGDSDLELDDIDALATTFATAISQNTDVDRFGNRAPPVKWDYDPYSSESSNDQAA